MELANRINVFDHWYNMSSDHRVWKRWNTEESAIKREIAKLSAIEAKEVFAMLSDRAKETEFGKAIEAMIPKPVSIHSRVFTAAWNYLKAGAAANLSEALKKAWAMIKGILSKIGERLSFAYTKTDGSYRKATGTISSVFVSKAGDTIVRYMDDLKGGYRSFKLDSSNLK